MIPGQPAQVKMFARLHFKGKKLGILVDTCHPSDFRELKIEELSVVQADLGKK
jgi:hypothetical protein